MRADDTSVVSPGPTMLPILPLSVVPRAKMTVTLLQALSRPFSVSEPPMREEVDDVVLPVESDPVRPLSRDEMDELLEVVEEPPPKPLNRDERDELLEVVEEPPPRPLNRDERAPEPELVEVPPPRPLNRDVREDELELVEVPPSWRLEVSEPVRSSSSTDEPEDPRPSDSEPE